MCEKIDNLAAGGPVTNWNVYSPRWAPVSVVNSSGQSGNSLALQDKDPYDYARAIRVFPETKSARVRFKVQAAQNKNGTLEVDVTDRYGFRPVRIVFDGDGQIQAANGGDVAAVARYEANQWYDFTINIDVAGGMVL